ncbi:MAG: hypothetical protein AM326_10510 [Candidatus Thorarchaeota archaeon SMTZ-45]|nr:MAG: hypothetical protein AM325_03070 [Candidatus Thorarchaeota archaeon SMTZ1-45]KXH73636.1 MAG: hypothetical protein AM326_10510 [Candidatus Thorarchaeota archaeon SMTZ-45]
MPSSTRPKVVGLVVILIVVIAVSGYMLAPLLFPSQSEQDTVTIHLLYTAGVMIEYNNTRIYVDPWFLLDNYTTLLADAILITHPHFDHYNETFINILQKDDTVNVIPASMSAEVALHDAIGVVPGDVVQLGDITVTAFHMYTLTGSHPREANWTSYLIDINGFRIFHGGDALNMFEYEQLTGLIDVALLPIYGYGMTVVSSIEMIQPGYFIPTHFDEGYDDMFFTVYEDDIASVSDCEIIRLEYWSSYAFEI